MKAIGGYPELELRKGKHYHEGALRLNTARNCLEYILLARDYRKVYVPYYTCEAVYEPFRKPGISCRMEFYHINEQLDPASLPQLKEGEAFLYTNYFGLKQQTVERLASIYGNRLIVDNSQAFYDMPLAGIDTFYSARKFFGVPDGAYLYTDKFLEDYHGAEIETDRSYDRMQALLKRIDLGAEKGYMDFQDVERSLCEQPIRRMSKLTEAILCTVDYGRVRKIRRNNYNILACGLLHEQIICLKLYDEAVPLCYPFFTKSTELRKRLIENRIYVPTYWSNVIESCINDRIEYKLSKNVMPIPIDQRYYENDMYEILNLINGK